VTDASQPLRAVCIYCASSSGNDPRYLATATAVGRLLGTSGITLVYGGGAVGLMGAAADGCLEAGGTVVGIIPAGLFRREVAHRGVTELIEVTSMHERKQLMYERSDAFVALPGGLGTLEEVAEIATWAQLGIHRKPIAMLDVAGYWSGLRQWLDGAVDAGLLKASNRALISWVDEVDGVLPALRAYDVPYEDKWLDTSET
jgi:uncharacterized protein (TIGR00730 family)